MKEIKNNLAYINEKLSTLFSGASLIKFSYSGIYTLAFELSREMYGFNYLLLDIGTQLSIFEDGIGRPFCKKFAMDDFFLIWSRDVKKVLVEDDLSISIYFDNEYCCKVTSDLFDPEALFDMRWSIYQKQNTLSFYLLVSDKQNIYLQIP